ncbi:AMP-binding protein [Teichococcus aestuarii]|uniref:AMP-binding protein n=1 Tax=Teichococcus aestuarii TaxID=568898 RepID=UPI0036103CB3
MPAPLPERPVGRDFLYSSGTTGLPKGIRRDLLPPEKRGAPDWSPGWVATYGIGQDSVYLSPAPLYHAAPHRYVMRTLDRGGTVVVMRKFDAARSLALIERHRVTHSQWVPTMFTRLLALPEAERRAHDLSSHRVAIHAAAPCPRAVKQAMIDWWGPILVEYYAGSESIGGTVIDSHDWLRRPGSVGRALECRLHILGPEGRSCRPARSAASGSREGPPSATTTRPRRPPPPSTARAAPPMAISAMSMRKASSISATGGPT